MNFIRILPGDKVTIELSPYDLTKGRIIGEINKTIGIYVQNILYKFCKIFLALIEKVVL